MQFPNQLVFDPDSNVIIDIRQAHLKREDHTWFWQQARKPVKPIFVLLAYLLLYFLFKKILCEVQTDNRRDMSVFYRTTLYQATLPVKLEKEIDSFYSNLSRTHRCGRGREGSWI